MSYVDEPVARARALAASGPRRLLGIAGPPGAGKSTLAEALVDALDGAAVLVPMDGFHLADRELARLGRADRKGAPDTFDAYGYAALLARLRSPNPDETVYAPCFERELEEPVAGALPVPPDVPLVITEGNYLLLDEPPWSTAVRPLLDEVWWVDVDDAVRVERLIARHVAFGKSPDRARSWVLRSDEANARRVASGRKRADAIVDVPG
ncbi:nucleoside/nucleotide kinase family protein [Streptomyces sp. NBC_00006]|uniref:nucleoside/nucleotide kinase family protein n=1 Tax=Streptomyces sp. NBC_00006 TaxID=2975619 RepID=UPI002258E37F|nr:nucleoside/nucleotide kinase family protein [Streptomyces sp. NBC_00006]MCX5532025.1 nucleoside/nucleotide kinase family protein [Streptomyces sp. NBC_00006]